MALRRLRFLLPLLATSALNAQEPVPAGPAAPATPPAGGVEEAPFLAWPDLRYAESPDVPAVLQSLDLFVKEGAKGLPVIVFFHGGSWAVGDKRGGLNWKPACFTQQGFLYASVNYRLVPEWTFEEQVADAAAAVGWLRAHVDEFGGDPGRLILMGHSSGAQLAALIATDERRLRALGLAPADLRGMVLLDGACYDIPLRVATEPGSRTRIEMVFGTEPGRWLEASPIAHVAAGKGIPPCLLVHVSGREVSDDESHRFAAALRAAGVRADVVAAAGRNHVTLYRELGAPDDPVAPEVLRFLQDVTRPARRRRPA